MRCQSPETWTKLARERRLLGSLSLLIAITTVCCAYTKHVEQKDITACRPGQRMVLYLDSKGHVVDVQCVGWSLPAIREKDDDKRFKEAKGEEKDEKRSDDSDSGSGNSPGL